jgi:hypothetical protein
MIESAAQSAEMLSYRVSVISQKRSRDAELIARRYFNMLVQFDPANAGWRIGYASSFLMESFYLLNDGQYDLARKGFQTVGSLFEAVYNDRPKGFLDAPGGASDMVLQMKLKQALCAAHSGDRAAIGTLLDSAQGWYRKARVVVSKDPDGWIGIAANYSYGKELVFDAGSDWVGLARTARESIDEIDQDLRERPTDSHALLFRAISMRFLGKALLRQGDVEGAVKVLELGSRGFREAPTSYVFIGSPDAEAAALEETLAEALKRRGENPRAGGPLERAKVVRGADFSR